MHSTVPTAPAPARPIALLTVFGLVTAVLLAALGGGAVAYVVGDPGAAVRWLLPVTRTLNDLAAATTIGLLGLAAFVMPETTRTNRRVQAIRLAAGSATVWLLAALAHVVLTFADLAGLRLGDAQFWPQLGTFYWSLDPTRTALVAAAFVAVVAVCATFVRTKTGAGWLFAVATSSLLPLALVGHSAASRDHMSGINALAAHLVAVSLWVGGLAGLAIMRRPLGEHLAVSVRRYSVVALWCFWVVLGSGVLMAYTTTSAWGDLRSAYGAILGLKLGVLLLCGWLGLLHRRRTLDRLDLEPQRLALFTRLVVGELVLMGTGVGAGVALARTPNPGEDRMPPPASLVYEYTGYPAPPAPHPGAWWSVWTIDWLWFVLPLVAIGVYLNWVRRLHHRGDAWPVLRTVSWVVGWLAFIYFTNGAPGVYGRVMFSWHMVMHMGVAMIVPILLVMGAPILLALRALPARHDKTVGPREFLLGLAHSRYLAVVANPAFAASMFFFSMALFYFTPWFHFSLTTHTGHVLMMVHFTMSGYFFVDSLVGLDPGPRKWSPLALMIVLFVTISFHAFFGVVLTSLDHVLAPDFFTQIQLPWRVDPLRDQNLGGQIAWGVGEAPTLAIALILAVQWVRTDDREARRRDRQADRDHDADLEAYNAYLARLRNAGERADAAEAARDEARAQARAARRH